MNKLLRLILVLAAFTVAAIQGRAFTATDMNLIPRVGSPSVSPDYKHFVTTVNVWDQVKNKKTTNLLLGDIVSSGSSATTRTLCKKSFVSDTNPMWVDDHTILFISNRNGHNNLWYIDINTPDAEPVQLTDYPVDIETAKYSSSNDRILFTATIYPGTTFEETVARDAEIASSRVKRQKWTKTFVRRWDSWYEDKYSHVFVTELSVGANGQQLTASPMAPVDLMGKMEGDCPSRPFGDSGEYAFSPKGDSYAFTTQLGDDKAWSTDLNVYVVDGLDGAEPQCITCGNNATDTSPAYSPDGRYIAYLAMAIPGYESDYKHIRIYDRETKTTRALADAWDVSVSAVRWSADGKTIYAEATDDAISKIYAVSVADGSVAEFAGEHTSSGYNIIPCVDDSNKKCAVYAMTSFSNPAEIFMTKSSGEIVQLTHESAAVLKDVEFTETLNFHFKGANDDEVQAWIQKPYGFDPAKKYPVVVMIHGGPESAWADSFHYRWNAQVFAAKGFVLFAPNPHGSSSFGSAFTKSILKDWGGKPYRDIMIGLDALGKEYEWADVENAGAIGASYGGYMINWINTQTDRFKCLVCHDGLFDTIANYWQTDELYFPYMEFGGLPTDEGNVYEQFSPSTFANKMNTPELIIHGGMDYRIPDVVGLSIFNNLQRRGVDSVFIRFPYENHYVTNPNNSIYWYDKVTEWLAKYLVEDNNKK